MGLGPQLLRPTGRRDGHRPLMPVQVKSLTGVVAVEAGYAHTVALKGDATVWTWGVVGGDNSLMGPPRIVQRLRGLRVSQEVWLRSPRAIARLPRSRATAPFGPGVRRAPRQRG